MDKQQEIDLDKELLGSITDIKVKKHAFSSESGTSSSNPLELEKVERVKSKPLNLHQVDMDQSVDDLEALNAIEIINGSANMINQSDSQEPPSPKYDKKESTKSSLKEEENKMEDDILKYFNDTDAKTVRNKHD